MRVLDIEPLQEVLLITQPPLQSLNKDHKSLPTLWQYNPSAWDCSRAWIKHTKSPTRLHASGQQRRQEEVMHVYIMLKTKQNREEESIKEELQGKEQTSVGYSDGITTKVTSG